jgi:molybdopterin-guanine dinucleotide biosynthesis protein A
MPGFAGPLAGLQAGLRRCGTDYLLSVPCDSPFLPADLAARLHGLHSSGRRRPRRRRDRKRTAGASRIRCSAW